MLYKRLTAGTLAVLTAIMKGLLMGSFWFVVIIEKELGEILVFTATFSWLLSNTIFNSWPSIDNTAKSRIMVAMPPQA